MKLKLPRAFPSETEIELTGPNGLAAYIDIEAMTAKCYHGKKCHPDNYYIYRSFDRLMEGVTDHFTLWSDHEKSKIQRDMEKKNFVHTLKVGDILHYSWGWEQTNCEFYLVQEVTLKMVRIQRCKAKTVGGEGVSSMACYLSPVAEPVEGKPIEWKRPNRLGVPMEFGVASLCDPKEKYYSSWYA